MAISLLIASLASIYFGGFIVMARGVQQAPEAIEDESGFRVVRQASRATVRPARRSTPRGMQWAVRRA
jgi:hypothetical protein